MHKMRSKWDSHNEHDTDLKGAIQTNLNYAVQLFKKLHVRLNCMFVGFPEWLRSLCVKSDWKGQFWGLCYYLSKLRSLLSFSVRFDATQ
jgi:hypothetical protein